MKLINNSSLKALTTSRVVVASTSSTILPTINQSKLKTNKHTKRLPQTKLKSNLVEKKGLPETPFLKPVTLLGHHDIGLNTVRVKFPSGSKSEL